MGVSQYHRAYQAPRSAAAGEWREFWGAIAIKVDGRRNMYMI
jgi:hypothetical protein